MLTVRDLQNVKPAPNQKNILSQNEKLEKIKAIMKNVLTPQEQKNPSVVRQLLARVLPVSEINEYLQKLLPQLSLLQTSQGANEVAPTTGARLIVKTINEVAPTTGARLIVKTINEVAPSTEAKLVPISTSIGPYAHVTLPGGRFVPYIQSKTPLLKIVKVKGLSGPIFDESDMASEEAGLVAGEDGLEAWSDIDSSVDYSNSDGTSFEFQEFDSDASDSDASSDSGLNFIPTFSSLSQQYLENTSTPTSSSTSDSDFSFKSVFGFLTDTTKTLASAGAAILPAYLQTNAAITQATNYTDLQKTLAAQSAALTAQQQQAQVAQQTAQQQALTQQALTVLKSAAASTSNANAASSSFSLSNNQMILVAAAALVAIFLFKK